MKQDLETNEMTGFDVGKGNPPEEHGSSLLQVNDEPEGDIPPLPLETDATGHIVKEKASAFPAPEPVPTMEPTDIGNAERFAWMHKGLIRFCLELQAWIIYQLGCWVVDVGDGIGVMAKSTINSLYQEAQKLTGTAKSEMLGNWRNSSTPSRMKAMVQLARWEPGIPIHKYELDRDPWLLNCKNGTLDLRTGILRDHDPEGLITRMTPIEYDPNATCPSFFGFVDRIMDGDMEMISFLQSMLGYMLTGDTSEQGLFVFWGFGSNGKSTLIETISKVLGPYALHTPSASLLSQRSGNIRNDIARLAGARMVSAIEVGSGMTLDEPLVKQLTGGDQVTARFLYREHFEFRPEFKIVLVANHKPLITGTDHGIWRRVHLVPFEVEFLPRR